MPYRISCAVVVFVTTAAFAQDLTIIEIGDPGPTSSVSPQGITDAQEAVGLVGGGTFIFRAGQTQLLTPPGGISSMQVRDISKTGLMVGNYTRIDEPFVGKAFMLDAQSLSFFDLGVPPTGDPDGVRGRAVSDDGTQILGEAQGFFDGTTGHVRRPVKWTDAGGAAIDYGSNDIVFTSINDINNSGQAVGSARTVDGPVIWQGYARVNGSWVHIGGPGVSRTDAFAINNLGVVTGVSRPTSSSGFAFRYFSDIDIMLELNEPSSMSRGVGLDINDLGTVVGSARRGSSTQAVYWPAGSVTGVNLNDLRPPDSGWSILTALTSVDSCGVAVGYGTRSDRPGYHSGFMIVLPEYDQDGDGLADCWEINGIDIDADGVIDLDLPAMGADPMRKDLFIEIDAMVGRAPGANVIQRVITAFANAPVTNLDGSTSITLHPIVDETNLPLRDYPNRFTDFNADKADRFGTFLERLSDNSESILASKRLAFRYCIFGNTYGGGTSSGLAETGGNDMMVTLGGWSTPGGTPDQQAGTFMHEFGHTIGLRHGGGDGVNYKPNYYSIMNYAWQMPKAAYAGSWRLDYSRVALPDLDEALLFEQDGLAGAPGSLPGVAIPFRATDGMLSLGVSNGPEPMDWDNSGMFELLPTASDLNRFYLSDDPSPGELLTGHDDWANLVYNFRLSPSFGEGVHETEEELTYEEHIAVEDEIGDSVACPADLAEPFGVLNFFDVAEYITLYNASDPGADLADPAGVFNFFDVVAFITSYNTGCP